MPERWRERLAGIEQAGPDESKLRRLTERGPRGDDAPAPRRLVRLGAGAIALALAAGSFVLVWSSFRPSSVPGESASPGKSATPPGSTSPSVSSSDGHPAIDPQEVCEVPPYDPDVALLVGSERIEYPKDVLEEPGVPASDLDGPGADAFRVWLASPDARHAPHDGWREIRREEDAVTFAAPPDGGYSDWWVVVAELREEGWKVTDVELVEQHQTPAQLGRDLELEWSGEVTIEDGAWTSTLRIRNGGESEWTGGGYWALSHVFDRETGELIGGIAAAELGDEDTYRAPPGGSVVVPVALGGVGTSLASGTYDLVGCIPQLALASPVGTLSVADGPADVDASVLTYVPTGASMLALGGGTLVLHNGCLAVANGPDDPRPTYVIWPEGYALVQRAGEAVLIDPIGRALGALGDEVTLGGGYVPLRLLLDSTIDGIPEACREDGDGYFLTSGAA